MREEEAALAYQIRELKSEVDNLIQKMNRINENPEVLIQTIALLNHMGEMEEKLQGQLNKLKSI